MKLYDKTKRSVSYVFCKEGIAFSIKYHAITSNTQGSNNTSILYLRTYVRYLRGN